MSKGSEKENAALWPRRSYIGLYMPGAGEEIRTLDINLGKVALYP